MIYNSIPQWQKITIQKKSEDKNKVILFAPGRLEYYKGFHLLIDAMKEFQGKNIKLYIAGTGPEEEKLKKMVHDYKLEEQVVFLGKLSCEEIKNYYFMCDGVLFPSIWPEPLGRIPLEAMAAGKVCIASNVGGIRELVSKEYLVMPTAKNFAKKINSIFL